MESLSVPKHVGIIMDGNGRWAKERNKPRSYGHKCGADRVEEVVTACFDRGVEAVSLYAFSTENWSRPKEEIDALFGILRNFLKRYSAKLVAEKIRLIISGDVTALRDDLRIQCEKCVKQTKDFVGRTFNIALNYGSRTELVRAMNLLLAEGRTSVTEEDVSGKLYTAGLPDIDLVIRTSGEMRLSNFFMWQCAYAELYFTPVYWPDFTAEELGKALVWFGGRKRRFGGI